MDMIHMMNHAQPGSDAPGCGVAKCLALRGVARLGCGVGQGQGAGKVAFDRPITLADRTYTMKNWGKLRGANQKPGH